MAAAAFGGRLREARTEWREAAEGARRSNLKESVAYLAAYQALIEAAFGNAREAREGAAAAVSASRSRTVLPTAAKALAMSGDAARAQALVDELRKRVPDDTLLKAIWLPVVSAVIETGHGAPAKAIEGLEAARPYELGQAFDFWAIYERGQAQLRAKSGVDAAAEFQRILEHRGVGPTSPFYALAQLGLARAAALQEDSAKSRRAYQDFLALWKEADPEVPILKEAKAEYARLQ
jgi:hypothetical protein